MGYKVILEKAKVTSNSFSCSLSLWCERTIIFAWLVKWWSDWKGSSWRLGCVFSNVWDVSLTLIRVKLTSQTLLKKKMMKWCTQTWDGNWKMFATTELHSVLCHFDPFVTTFQFPRDHYNKSHANLCMQLGSHWNQCRCHFGGIGFNVIEQGFSH